MNYLNDNNFLVELVNKRSRETYARITALTWQETPIEYIEGKITGGSINLDGASALQRTCSLNLVAQEININNFYWGLHNKIKIEIGLKNNVNAKYPEIIWFPQGIYILTSFNTSISTNNYTISINAKDKMCMLNGDIGGNLPASIDFGVLEEVDADNNITYTHIPIKDIIKNAVHVYGQEPLHNIVISDIDKYGYELLEYRGAVGSELYLFREVETGSFTQMTMNKTLNCLLNGIGTTIGEIKYDDRVDIAGVTQGDEIQLVSGGTKYRVCKISTGETVGYRLTDLTYAGDLISKIGESLTSILDKIKNMLGNFEYFYDIDGRFIFRQKKNNYYNNWNPLTEDGEGELHVDATAAAISYKFQNSELFSSISHTPTLNNIKNDYSIWGERQGVSGAKIPVHFRYALDRKPKVYTSFEITEAESLALINEQGWPFTYNQEDSRSEEQQKKDKYKQSQITYTVNKKPAQNPDKNTRYELDWRELIYRMALDYYKFNALDNFLTKIKQANSTLYPSGYTGYENYYLDIQGFWRQLYNPHAEEEGDDNYYVEGEDNQYWHKDVFDNPSTLNFWFDFLGEGTQMDKYLVPAIGPRTKVKDDKKITAIYFKEIPDVLFIDSQEYFKLRISGDLAKMGYTYIQINDSFNGMFNISSQGKSAQDVLNELLYENTYCSETISITSIPLYYLQVNSRISVVDDKCDINGEYIISKITLPLTYNGTMSITATKAIDLFY